MATVREINIKPSCMSEIHGVPASQAHQLWEKINYLVENPLPDGKIKKKLRAKKGLYRLRVGDYRVFYTFGDTWVRLLGIRRRDERTYGDKLTTVVAGAPDTVHGVEEDDLDELLEGGRRRPEFRLQEASPATPLPRPITVDWLRELKLSPSCYPALIRCESEEALLAAGVEAEILERVLDNLFPRPIDEVAAQPDLVVKDTQDLVRYKNGDLLDFLLRLDEDQQRLTEWALKGPTMVKGGAGTGKSTVALYRVKALLERPGSTGSERVLFTTYTRALVQASRQLLEQLLTEEQFARVRVATCDEIAREVVASQRKLVSLEAGGTTLAILKGLRKDFLPTGPTGFDRRLRARVLDKLSDRYLLDEFEWIIEGRGLNNLDEYRAAARPGRGVPFRDGLKETVWELHQVFLATVRQKGIERFSSIRNEALAAVQSGNWAGQYDYVVVDEAQDLTPTALCLMAEVARSEEGLFFAADDKQSLYSRNYSWPVVHPRLRFKGRTAVLRRNYRSTAEIDRAAFEVLGSEENEDHRPSQSVHSGTVPVLLRGVPEGGEAEWAARFVRQMSRHLRMKTASAAVLTPTNATGQRLAEEINRAGVPARYFAGRELDLQADVVKVLTLYSAKGLEFPVVVLAGFDPGTYPVPETFAEPDVYEERMRTERRLLYVGMTRAMRGLMVMAGEECEHEALLGLDSDNWYVEDLA